MILTAVRPILFFFSNVIPSVRALRGCDFNERVDRFPNILFIVYCVMFKRDKVRLSFGMTFVTDMYKL